MNIYTTFLYLIKQLRVRYYHRIVLYSILNAYSSTKLETTSFWYYVILFYEIILYFRNYATQLSRWTMYRVFRIINRLYILRRCIQSFANKLFFQMKNKNNTKQWGGFKKLFVYDLAALKSIFRKCFNLHAKKLYV